jgi:hypothetical protein
MSIIFKSWILPATNMKPIAAKQDDRTVDASAGVVLQLDDASELTVEVNDLIIMFSLSKDTVVLRVSKFLMVNYVVTYTVNNTG